MVKWDLGEKTTATRDISNGTYIFKTKDKGDINAHSDNFDV